MNCKSILVVEDDEDIRTQVKKALELEGYDVVTADNGRSALDLLISLEGDKLPGCMILDLMMPEMDGKQLVEEMDLIPSLSEIVIIVATAKGSPINPQSISRAAARIQKPFELDKLYSLLEKHCGKP